MDSFQQQALCFSLPTGDFDPNQVPTDGEEYLQSVIYERNKCPAVVVRPLKRNVESNTKPNESKTSRSVWDQYAEVGFFLKLSRWTIMSLNIYSFCSF